MRKINTDLADYIGSWTITSLIDKIDEVKEDSEISWNSGGGSTAAGQKFADYLNNKEHKLNANVTGMAASMGAVLLPFFDHVKGAIQADVMIHSLSGGVKSTRRHTNEFLYGALAKKVDEAKFKEITGYELKDVMLAEDEDRVDIWLTGKQAGEIKLFDETYDLLDKAASVNKIDLTNIDYELPEHIKEKYNKQAKIVKSNHNEMEIKDVKQAELKSGNPSVYNAIEKEAVNAEKTRVASIMKYAKYDMEKAAQMIEDGSSMGEAELEHFIEKKHAAKKVDELHEEGVELNPAQKEAKVEVVETQEQKDKEAALERLRGQLGTSDLVETDKK